MSANPTSVSAIILFYQYSSKLDWSSIKNCMDSLQTPSLIVEDTNHGGFWVYLDAAQTAVTPEQLQEHEFPALECIPSCERITEDSKKAYTQRWVRRQGLLKHDGFDQLSKG